MKRIIILFLVYVVLFTTSCKTDGEVGVGEVYIQNNTSAELKIETTYKSQFVNTCPSCMSPSGQALLIGSDSDFGASPAIQQIISKIRIYRNDSLKIESGAPFENLEVGTTRGKGRYDKRYTIYINNSDLE